MGTPHSSQAITNGTDICTTIARRQGANYRLIIGDREIDFYSCWNKQLQLIKNCKILLLLEQVCVRLESLKSNPNVSTARNELVNTFCKLATQIDLYQQKSGQLHFGDIELDRKLLALQPKCSEIANKIDHFVEEDQLSTEEFRVLAQEFLDIYRPFYVKLLKAINGGDYVSDSEVKTTFERIKEWLQRFTNFLIKHRERIFKSADSGADVGLP